MQAMVLPTLAAIDSIPGPYWIAPIAGVTALVMAVMFNRSVLARSEGDDEMIRIAAAVRDRLDLLREEVLGNDLDDVRRVGLLGRNPPRGLIERLGVVLARQQIDLIDRLGDRRRVLVQPSDPRRIVVNPARNLAVSTGHLRVGDPEYGRRNHREPDKRHTCYVVSCHELIPCMSGVWD